MKTIDKQYFELVDIDTETNEITILDSLFEYEGGMRGATGSKFEPITEDQIQDSISEYEVINPFSFKWNLHSSNCDYILNELDERLNNLKWLTKKSNLELTIKN